LTKESSVKPNPVGWFEIYVQDINRAKTFYETILRTKLERLPSPVKDIEMWAFPSERGSTGTTGALAKMDGVRSGGNSTLVYFVCEDCAVEQGRVEGAGGEVHKQKFSIGEHGFISLAVDTEGNMFGLHSRK